MPVAPRDIESVYNLRTSLGNQAGLILSAYLGLSLTDPLNKLGVEASKARKEVQYVQSLSEREIELAEQQIAALTSELQTTRDRLKEITATQQARRRAVENAESNRRLLEMQATFQEKNAELVAHQAEQENLGARIQQDRKRERQVREAVRLQLHFTGISVTLCPNCDTVVDEEAVTHEQETHACRLCGKPAHHAPQEEIAAVELLKHNQPVAFTGIRNDGERLRVKLAFFLAMMQLAREAGGGHHPGFLIIDQPGSNEMVPNDFSALAQVFRQIDQEFGSEIQVLFEATRAQVQRNDREATLHPITASRILGLL